MLIREKITKMTAAAMCLTFLSGMATGLITDNKVYADQAQEQTATEEEGIRGYVARMYYYVLERPADGPGIDDWESRVRGGTSAAEVAWGFFNSDEFKRRGLSNSDYLDILYLAILGRPADEPGKAYWEEQLESGFPRNRVLEGFIDSKEFGEICDTYGVTRGNIILSDILDIHYKAAQFVTRAYRIILQREPDEPGLRDWVHRLSSGRASASDIIYGFFASDEFISRNFSDEEYVEFLYQALLSRGADEQGKANWVSILNESNVSRMYLLKGFIDSEEFGLLCNEYEIPKGTFATTEARDLNPAANLMIINGYESVFGREPEIDELNHWAREFYNGKSATTFLNGLYSADSFNELTTEQKVAVIYQSAFGREATADEITAAAAEINANGLSKYLDTVYHSQEFDTYCKSHGVGTFFNAGFNKINGRKFYYINGALATGWQRIDGNRYYFDPSSGNAAVTGWKYIEGYKYFFDTEGRLVQNVESIIGPQSRYYLTVNCYTNTVMVYAYDSANGTFDIPVKAIVCSCGTAGNETIQGDFTLQRLQPWRELMGDVYGQYCTRISGNFLFHSAWFYEAGNHQSVSVRQYNLLGQNASHGCVRLTTADAKWIYENCNGSAVHVFTNNQPAPFDKPTPPRAVPVHGDYGYDPTDPAL